MLGVPKEGVGVVGRGAEEGGVGLVVEVWDQAEEVGVEASEQQGVAEEQAWAQQRASEEHQGEGEVLRAVTQGEGGLLAEAL